MRRKKSQIKNRLLILFVVCCRFFLRKKHAFSSSSPRFLIVATTALGDSLWATPAIAAIKKKYPHSFLGILASNKGKEAFLHNPDIDELIIFQEPLFFSFFFLLKKLRKKKFQIVFLFHASQRLIFPLCNLLGAEKTLTTKDHNKGLDSLFTELLPQTKEHEIQRRCRQIATCHIFCQDFSLRYFVQKEEMALAEQFLLSHNLTQQKPLIILHPGAADPHRRWPIHSFIELTKKLTEHNDLQILATAKEPYLQEAFANSGCNILCFSLPLRIFAALLKKTDLLICNDSGPFHLAIANKTKTLGLSIPTDPDITGPYNTPFGYMISKTPPCSFCIQRKCAYPHCWELITPMEVYQKTMELIGRGGV